MPTNVDCFSMYKKLIICKLHSLSMHTIIETEKIHRLKCCELISTLLASCNMQVSFGASELKMKQINKILRLLKSNHGSDCGPGTFFILLAGQFHENETNEVYFREIP